MTDFLVKMQPILPSHLSTTVLAKFPWLDVVQDYGATGDGTTDDYTAFSNCLTAAATLGKPVMVPAGLYALSAGLTVDAPVRIFSFAGPYLTTLLGPTAGTALTLTGGADYSEISGIQFRDNSSLGTGLSLYGPRECRISNCWFVNNLYGAAIQTVGTDAAFYNSFLECLFTGNTNGVYLSKIAGATYSPNRTHFIGCLFRASSLYHAYIAYGGGTAFVKCDFGSAPTMVYTNAPDTTVQSCAMEGDSTTDLDEYFRNDASGTPFSFIDTTVSHGVLNISTSTKGYLFLRNNESQLYRRSFIVQQDASTDEVFYSRVSTDTAYRFKIESSGKLAWGDGTATRDTTLYRSEANVLTTDDTISVAKWLRFPPPTYVTISDGVITTTGTYTLIETEGGAVTDDLDTITAGTAGDILILEAYDATHSVVIKHGTGNIYCSGKVDFTLDARHDKAMFIYSDRAPGWDMISCSDNN